MQSKQGVLLLGGKPSLVPLGVIPASAVLSISLTDFPLPPGWDGRTLEFQAWASTPGGASVLSGPSTTAIVDPALCSLASLARSLAVCGHSPQVP
ncbi:MAG TPA: hypothetical protein VMT18_07840 [Planctomycetota bacterium]|nr:hypothetical protein [Planctomycetota bacterium]